MHGFPPLSDEIEFEVPSYASVRRFAARLSLAWPTFVEELEDSTLIIVEFGPRPTSFARVLRLGEEWVRNETLGAIRFAVDGRSYVLKAGELDWQLDMPAAA
jgi:hypothetical protein